MMWQKYLPWIPFDVANWLSHFSSTLKGTFLNGIDVFLFSHSTLWASWAQSFSYFFLPKTILCCFPAATISEKVGGSTSKPSNTRKVFTLTIFISVNRISVYLPGAAELNGSPVPTVQTSPRSKSESVMGFFSLSTWNNTSAFVTTRAGCYFLTQVWFTEIWSEKILLLSNSFIYLI